MRLFDLGNDDTMLQKDHSETRFIRLWKKQKKIYVCILHNAFDKRLPDRFACHTGLTLREKYLSYDKDCEGSSMVIATTLIVNGQRPAF